MRPFAGSLLVVLPLLAGRLHAQEPADSAAARDTVRLPEVTVTATRTPARVLDVPLAVTVIRGADLRGAAGNRIDQALRTVPGVLAQSRTGGSDIRIVIRGFGARGRPIERGDHAKRRFFDDSAILHGCGQNAHTPKLRRS